MPNLMLIVLACTSEKGLTTYNAAPTVSILSHQDGEVVSAHSTIEFLGSVSDSNHTYSQLQASWYAGSREVCTDLIPTASSEVSCSITLLQGEDSIRLEARDPGGATSSDKITLVLEEPQPPNAIWVSPLPNNLYPSNQYISFSAILSDADDPPSSLQTQWTSSIDGALLVDTNPDSLGVIEGFETLSTGDHIITLTVTDSDGLFVVQNNIITVGTPNESPSIPTLALSPSPAYTIDDIYASASGSIDPEGSIVSYQYEWLQNGNNIGLSTDTLLSSLTQKNEVWTVRVTASDGVNTGPYAEASLTINNSVPTAPTLSITPASPTENVDDLICSITTSSTDNDGDPITYTFEWYDPSGNLVQSTIGTTLLSDTLLANGTTTSGSWSCVVYADDGQDTGTATTALVNVQSEFSGCQNGSVDISLSPNGDMVLCDDPTDITCEQDFETLCPSGWHLCTYPEFINRNAGWNHTVTHPARALGVRYCRSPNSGAGHFTVPDATFESVSLSTTPTQNCYFGTSRPDCSSGYGCNEKQGQALCCSPNPSCGNGVVDHPEETCDDGNNNDTDSCLNVCDVRVLTGSGTNCN